MFGKFLLYCNMIMLFFISKWLFTSRRCTQHRKIVLGKQRILPWIHHRGVQNKLDLRIEEPMQICIHWKDNSPKPVKHHLTLKEGPKVKSDNIRRFPAHDILQVGFTLQTSRTNNKRVMSTLKFGCTHLTLNEGLKVKSDYIRSFPAHDFL